MLRETTFIVMLALSLVAVICGIGVAEENESDIFEMRARITSIDLTYNRIEIAEKEMVLLSHFKNNRTVWDTRFLDMSGNQISPDRIKSRSSVLVRWEIDNGTSIAREIILLE